MSESKFRPILYTDFNMIPQDGCLSAEQSIWGLLAGQEVILAEHGDSIYCYGVVVEPNAFKGSSTGKTYVRVKLTPDSWGHFREAAA